MSILLVSKERSIYMLFTVYWPIAKCSITISLTKYSLAYSNEFRLWFFFVRFLRGFFLSTGFKSYASPWPVWRALPFPDESQTVVVALLLLLVVVIFAVVAVDFNASVVGPHCFAVYYLKMKRCNELCEACGMLHVPQIPHRHRERSAGKSCLLICCHINKRQSVSSWRLKTKHKNQEPREKMK